LSKATINELAACATHYSLNADCQAGSCKCLLFKSFDLTRRGNRESILDLPTTRRKL